MEVGRFGLIGILFGHCVRFARCFGWWMDDAILGGRRGRG